jgi:hypothetical protein
METPTLRHCGSGGACSRPSSSPVLTSCLSRHALPRRRWRVVVWKAPTQSRFGGGVAARPRRPGARPGLPCPVPAAAAAAARRRRGRVAIAERSLGGVGPEGGRNILFFHIISARPSKQPRKYLPKGIWSSAPIFVSARTNKRHHHHWRYERAGGGGGA